MASSPTCLLELSALESESAHFTVNLSLEPDPGDTIDNPPLAPLWQRQVVSSLICDISANFGWKPSPPMVSDLTILRCFVFCLPTLDSATCSY